MRRSKKRTQTFSKLETFGHHDVSKEKTPMSIKVFYTDLLVNKKLLKIRSSMQHSSFSEKYQPPHFCF